MTYKEAMEKIDSRLLFGMRPGLERISALLSRIGDPQNQLRCVHVCGTNGKGTTCTLTASVLREAGYRTGLFTSPYVIDFRERYQINGEMIPEAELIAEVEELWPIVEQLDGEGCAVSEFELVTAIGFHWFKKRGCDIVVLEVGMGGAYDATNVIPTPEAVAITSISLDHTAWLGDTVEKIAAEKSGVIKDGGRVVLYPEQQPGVREIIEAACRERSAELIVPDMSLIHPLGESIDGAFLETGGLRLHTPFLGAHQVKNAATALEVIKVLRRRGFAISDEQLQSGFAKAFIPARMEIISRSPLCLLDGGHNPGCALALRDALARFVPGRRVAIAGMMADKDSASALETVGPMFEKIVAVQPQNPRAMSAGDLADVARRYSREAVPAGSVAQALDMAAEDLAPEDALIVCGSFYLAGEIRPLLMERFGGTREPA